MPEFGKKTEKFLRAMSILRSCLGTKGVWADPSRYAQQCWTRDFAMAIQPLLLILGEKKAARNHLNNLRDAQRPNGQIPIVFLDDEQQWLKGKEAKSAEQGRESFMLRRYREGELWNLTPGTKDSELHYILAVLDHFPGKDWNKEYMRHFHPSVCQAYDYLEKNLIVAGVFVGCDWRDTMERQFSQTALLTNNSLLYRMYQHINEFEKAKQLKQRINEELGYEGTFRDYAGSQRFDPLGLAFAVLNDVADPASYDDVIRAFGRVDSPCGVTIKCRHNPLDAEEARMIEETDGEVVWPFVVGFVVLALLKMERYAEALVQFDKLAALNDFREYYDPRTGKGYGAAEQLWSAVLFLRVYLNMMSKGLLR